MRARIVKIGNSQGIRIPKPLLEQLKINEDVDIEVKNNHGMTPSEKWLKMAMMFSSTVNKP
jgi:antitoxin component of MazEF toxin-antitoxin module